MVSLGPKILKGKFQTLTITSFKLCTILSGMKKSHIVLLHHAQDVNCPLVPHVHAEDALCHPSHGLPWCPSAGVQVALLLLNKGPKALEQ